MVEEAIPAMLLLEDEDEGDLVNGVVLQHIRVTRCNNLLCIVDSNSFQGVVKVGDRDLLNL